VCSVLSGNRNFEGCIHPEAKLNYLASPPLVVVAYALAGSMDVNLASDPPGTGADGQPGYLRGIWPPAAEIGEVIAACLRPEMFIREYAQVFAGDQRWRSLPVPSGDAFARDPASACVRRPPCFDGLAPEPAPLAAIEGARVLALPGDSVTTDHISPAGAIRAGSPAGQHLRTHGAKPQDFNSYGSRRGNHEVTIRGTFANIRLRSHLAPATGGRYTRHQPGGEQATLCDAAQRYAAEGVPLLVIAAKEYGSTSSRDWAANRTALLGVRAMLATSFEPIHRTSLTAMGVLPLQFPGGEDAASLGLTGQETYTARGLAGAAEVPRTVTVTADGPARTREFLATARIDTPAEAACYRARRHPALRAAPPRRPGREGAAVTAVLTPVLTARWDEPGSFTLEDYRRAGGYRALARALRMDPSPGSPPRTPTPKFARLALATNDIDLRARVHSAEEAQFLAAGLAGRGIGVSYARLGRAPAVLLAGFEPEDESPIDEPGCCHLRMPCRRPQRDPAGVSGPGDHPPGWLSPPQSAASAPARPSVRHQRRAAACACRSPTGRTGSSCSDTLRSNRGSERRPASAHTVRPRCQSQSTANPAGSPHTMVMPHPRMRRRTFYPERPGATPPAPDPGSRCLRRGTAGTILPARARSRGMVTSSPDALRTVKVAASATSRTPRTSAVSSPFFPSGRRQRITTRRPTSPAASRTSRR
jgi:hypothetical protein